MECAITIPCCFHFDLWLTFDERKDLCSPSSRFDALTVYADVSEIYITAKRRQRADAMYCTYIVSMSTSMSILYRLGRLFTEASPNAKFTLIDSRYALFRVCSV